MEYNRKKAIEYAKTWALSRNPKFHNFDGIGGDCTNFVSQCIYAGAGVMNFTRDIGWYYISAWDRAAAWTGVEYLNKFLIRNKSKGPYASQVPLSDVEAGDVIQFSFDGYVFGHSVFVIATMPKILVAQHSTGQNYDNRPLSTYDFEKIRVLHIEGVNS